MAKREIKDAQYLVQKNPLDSIMHRTESVLVKEYVRIAQAEESFLRQKSWVH